MRFELVLELDLMKGDKLPFNYQYAVSSWIYKCIARGDPEYAGFLHEEGYQSGQKRFRLFQFSRLEPDRFRAMGDRMHLSEPGMKLKISFLPEPAIRGFIQGLFSGQEFSLGDRISAVCGRVTQVSALPEPEFQECMRYRLSTPLHLAQQRPGTTDEYDHLDPGHPDFTALFFLNLVSKYEACPGADPISLKSAELKILSEPRKKVILIKPGTPQQTKISAYLFDFELTAPLPLQRLGYYTGFGKLNSQGFGFGEIK